MKPIEFKGQNVVFAKDQKVTTGADIIKCWQSMCL